MPAAVLSASLGGRCIRQVAAPRRCEPEPEDQGQERARHQRTDRDQADFGYTQLPHCLSSCDRRKPDERDRCHLSKVVELAKGFKNCNSCCRPQLQRRPRRSGRSERRPRWERHETAAIRPRSANARRGSRPGRCAPRPPMPSGRCRGSGPRSRRACTSSRRSPDRRSLSASRGRCRCPALRGRLWRRLPWPQCSPSKEKRWLRVWKRALKPGSPTLSQLVQTWQKLGQPA